MYSGHVKGVWWKTEGKKLAALFLWGITEENIKQDSLETVKIEGG